METFLTHYFNIFFLDLFVTFQTNFKNCRTSQSEFKKRSENCPKLRLAPAATFPDSADSEGPGPEIGPEIDPGIVEVDAADLATGMSNFNFGIETYHFNSELFS